MLEQDASYRSESKKPFYLNEAFVAVGHDANGPILEKITACHLDEPLVLDGDVLNNAFGYQIGGPNVGSYPSIEMPGRREILIQFPNEQHYIYEIMGNRGVVHRYVFLINPYGPKIQGALHKKSREFFEVVNAGNEVFLSVQEAGTRAPQTISELEKQAVNDADVPQAKAARDEKARIVELFDICRAEQEKYEQANSHPVQEADGLGRRALRFTHR